MKAEARAQERARAKGSREIATTAESMGIQRAIAGAYVFKMQARAKAKGSAAAKANAYGAQSGTIQSGAAVKVRS